MADVKLTFGYADTDFTRLYTFSCDDSLLSGIPTKVNAINASLAGGTDGGLAAFFQSDDGHNFVKIVKASAVALFETPIDLNGGE